MKQFFVTMSFCLMTLWSVGQSPLDTQIDFDVDKMPLTLALAELGKTAGIPISYSDNILPKNKFITLKVRNQKVRVILSRMLRDSDIQFKAIGAQVVLFYKKRPKRNFTISGFIEDKDSGEQLISANIFDRTNRQGTSSNEYGFFSLTIPEGNIELVISYTGYNTETIQLNLNKNKSLQLNLRPNLTLKEIIVTPDDFQDLNTSEPLSADDIPLLQMKNLPALGGEADLFRIAEMMPGVQSGSDGLGGLHVRGGNADQNLILMDGVPIYNPSHGLGILSVFNSEVIQSAQLYKGAFPARYGGRLSSILDVRTREGNKKKWSGNIKAGMIASSALIEGPIIKDKVSILLTARRTLLDRFVQNQSRKNKNNNEFFMENFGVPLQGVSNYNFYDLNGKINFSLSEKDKFYFSYYTGEDKFSDEDRIENAPLDGFIYSDSEIQKYNWGNHVGVFRWNHLFNNKLFMNTTLTSSVFTFQSQESLEVDIIPTATIPPLNIFFADSYYSTLRDWGGKIDFEYSSSKNHHLRFGVNSTLHTFQPGAFGADTEVDNEIVFEVDIDSFLTANRISALNHNIYFEDEFSPHKKLKFNIGFQANIFDSDDKKFFSLQPRISANYQIINQLSLHGAISRMTQPLHLVTGSDAGFPNDLWLPSTDLVPPQTSWQGVIGLQYQPHKSLLLSIEGYYKNMENLVSYIDNASLRAELSNPSSFTFQQINTENWESQVTTGSGEAYGLEFQLSKRRGRLTGGISYTLAYAGRQFEEINNGEVFPYRYDRRHNLSLAFNYKLSTSIDFSCNWIYGTGLSTLIPVSTFKLGDITIINYDFTRMPANHRLDAGFNFNLKLWKLDQKIYVGAYNIYNRSNPQYYQLRSTIKEGSDPNNPEYDFTIFEGSFLPFLPSLSYSISF